MQTVLDKFQEALRMAVDGVEEIKKEKMKLAIESEKLEALADSLAPKLDELKKREAAVDKIERTEAFIKDTEQINIKNQEERAKIADERQKFILLKQEQEVKHKEQLIMIANEWKKLRGE